MLVGCGVCLKDYTDSPSASVAAPTKPGTRVRQRERAPPTAHLAKPRGDPTAGKDAHILKPQNEASFLVLPDIEVAGRSRTFTGEKLDPDSCAERCLANKGCDAFSFEREAKLCYLIG